LSDTDRILDKIDDTKAELHERINRLEEKLLDPDNGLYARVKKNTNFRKSAKKILGVLGITTLGILAKIVYEGIREFFRRGHV
jgi:hypothetical protein